MRIDNTQAWEVLGAKPGASPEELHAAYLAKVKQHPPDRSPEQFEKIRDAYELLRDPRVWMKRIFDMDPSEPLEKLLDQLPAERRFAGPKAWLAVLEKGVPQK